MGVIQIDYVFSKDVLLPERSKDKDRGECRRERVYTSYYSHFPPNSHKLSRPEALLGDRSHARSSYRSLSQVSSLSVATDGQLEYGVPAED